MIDGKLVARTVRERVAGEAAEYFAATGRKPHLAVLLCGDDPASATYVRNKGKVAASLGIDFTLKTPPGASSPTELQEIVESFAAAADVDGILVQLPLPSQVNQDDIIDLVPPEKDADGFHPVNFGRLAAGRNVTATACTPAGCMELLRAYDVPITGANAVVIGRSTIVGRPMAALLTNADATVTVCHSKTRDLPGVCRAADILIAAIGRPGMITADFVKPGAAVIDVGTTILDEVIRGDVDRASVEPVAGWLSPVPGGVGPMTIAMLMSNTVALARARAGL